MSYVCTVSVYVRRCTVHTTAVSEHGIGSLLYSGTVLLFVSLSRVQLRERDREIELCERRGRESRASLRDSDPLGAAGSSSSTAEPAPPTGKGEESSCTTVSDLEWWPGDNK